MSPVIFLSFFRSPASMGVSQALLAARNIEQQSSMEQRAVKQLAIMGFQRNASQNSRITNIYRQIKYLPPRSPSRITEYSPHASSRRRKCPEESKYRGREVEIE